MEIIICQNDGTEFLVNDIDAEEADCICGKINQENREAKDDGLYWHTHIVKRMSLAELETQMRKRNEYFTMNR